MELNQAVEAHIAPWHSAATPEAKLNPLVVYKHGMFDALWEGLAKLSSWRWPVAQGQVVLAAIEIVPAGEGFSGSDGHCQLRVTYKFNINADGPYVGEACWTPTQPAQVSWTAANDLEEDRAKLEPLTRQLPPGYPVQVRYRPDDPRVNKLDGGVEKLLRK